MNVLASVATTADGYLDDASTERLMISSPEDWAEVRRLRARYEAILVGAETLRRDNPALTLRDKDRRQRMCEGRQPELTKVTVTASGDLTPEMRFFTEGTGDKIVFSNTELPHLQKVATVISTKEPITAAFIVTELEKRGIGSLFVEGGAKILRMFFAESMVDTLRLAVSPGLRLGDCPGAPRLDIGTAYLCAPHVTAHFGNTQVTTYTLRPDTEAEDLKYLRLAIGESRKCTPGATSYCVGAVVRTLKGEVFTGYTHETSPTHHAEQEAIAKALAAGATLRGAAIYSSMEPCSQRSSEPESCSALIIRHGFGRVVFALYEPACFVNCRGALNLRQSGVEVRVYPALGGGVRSINGHLCE